ILRPTGGGGYNELVIENPEVAGVYVKWDDKMPQLEEGVSVSLGHKSSPEVLEDRRFRTYGQGRDRYSQWWDNLQEVMRHTPMVFVLDQQDNSVRELFDIDVVERSFKVTPKLSPGDVLSHQRSKEQKRESATRVLDKVSARLTEEEKKQYLPTLAANDGVPEGRQSTA
ncbi:MAG: hypothetical protein AAB555_03250, partial [Patescibacteria group bacterium]